MFRLLLVTSLASVFRAPCVTAQAPAALLHAAVDNSTGGAVNGTGTNATTAAMSLRAVDFEISGRVQGVFFRKYTKQEADKLGLKGWCLNTSKGTVLGHMQGPNDKIETMMRWLKTKGSPSSQIEKAEFRNQKDISNYEFNSFDIRKDN